MQELVKAIYAKFVAAGPITDSAGDPITDSSGDPIYPSGAEGSTIYTDLDGQLYYLKAPQRQDPPFAVFNVVQIVPDFYYGRRHESVLVRFNIVSSASGTNEIFNIITQLKTLFDDRILTVSGYTHFMFERELEVGPDVEILKRYYTHVIEYKVLIGVDR